MEDLILDLNCEYTIVFVTHNLKQAARIYDYTTFFDLGELIKCGSTNTRFANPAKKRIDDYVTGRFG